MAMGIERRNHSSITFVRLIQTPRGVHLLRGRIEMAGPSRFGAQSRGRDTTDPVPEPRVVGGEGQRHSPAEATAA